MKLFPIYRNIKNTFQSAPTRWGKFYRTGIKIWGYSGEMDRMECLGWHRARHSSRLRVLPILDGQVIGSSSHRHRPVKRATQSGSGTFGHLPEPNGCRSSAPNMVFLFFVCSLPSICIIYIYINIFIIIIVTILTIITMITIIIVISIVTISIITIVTIITIITLIFYYCYYYI